MNSDPTQHLVKADPIMRRLIREQRQGSTPVGLQCNTDNAHDHHGKADRHLGENECQKRTQPQCSDGKRAHRLNAALTACSITMDCTRNAQARIALTPYQNGATGNWSTKVVSRPLATFEA